MDYTLVTTVAAAHHLIILDDWLDFLGPRPRALNVLLGEAPGLEETVAEFCAGRGIAFAPAGLFDAAARTDETDSLLAQMRAVMSPLAFVTRLDSFPYREGHAGWLEDAAARLSPEHPFLTGACRPYRTDTPAEAPDLMLTRRLSNNLLLTAPDFWSGVLEAALADGSGRTRFFSEAALERHCTQTGLQGYRRLNRPDWRVFHTQVWGEAEQAALRQSYRKGHRITPYMHGFEDDQRHPWTRYYLSPAPPPLKRLRIAAGAFRQRLQGVKPPPR